MNYRLRVQKTAWENASQIYHWLSQYSPEGADRWYAAFYETLNDLSIDPLRSGIASESEKIGSETRERFFKTKSGRNYRILYQIRQETVIVLCVRAPGQEPVTKSDLE